MASIVTITPAAEGVTCAAGASAEHTFTVTSTAGTTLGIGARVLASDPRQEGWLTLEGKSERTLPAGSTDQFTVTVRVPADARPEPCTFRLLVFSTRQPDEDFTEGPLVSVQVTPAGQPTPPPPPPFPWWIVAVAVLVLLVGGGLTAWLLWPKGVEVPQVAGLGLKVEEAVQRLEEAGLTFTSETRESAAQPAGIVLEQSPAPGSSVGKGSAVALVVSAAPSQEPTVKVPTVVSLAYEDARRELEEKGLRVERMDPPQATREFRPGQVTAQIPGGNSSARRGDTVRLKVAGESVEVPRLEGQTLQAAITTLGQRRLVLKAITGDQDKLGEKVVGTTPAAGELVLAGAEVTIHMPGQRLQLDPRIWQGLRRDLVIQPREGLVQPRVDAPARPEGLRLRQEAIVPRGGGE